jgi:hypothetical protein
MLELYIQLFYYGLVAKTGCSNGEPDICGCQLIHIEY